MTGELRFSGSSGVRFTTGVLTGNDGDLRFAGKTVCRAAVAVAGCGDIEGVSAGSGLSGGGSAGAVALAVANGGITGAHINPGTTITAADFRYSAPVTRFLALGPSDFASVSHTQSYFRSNVLQGTVGGQLQSFVAPVHVPDGATITSMEVFLIDNAAEDMQVHLRGKFFTATADLILGSVASSGAASGARSFTDTTIGQIIDNDSGGRHVLVTWTTPQAVNTMALLNVLLTYTVQAP